MQKYYMVYKREYIGKTDNCIGKLMFVLTDELAAKHLVRYEPMMYVMEHTITDKEAEELSKLTFEELEKKKERIFRV